MSPLCLTDHDVGHLMYSHSYGLPQKGSKATGPIDYGIEILKTVSQNKYFPFGSHLSQIFVTVVES